ncbi:MAG: hypothetical protein Q9207_004892 [Kuettlingeria erythrocarpa]
MAPGGGGKRKRGDRNYSYDASHDNQRPSPHRPGNLSLAQQSPQQQHFSRDQYDQRGGRRRGSRGGRGGGSQRSPINSPNPTTQRRSSGGPSTLTPQPATSSPAAPTKPPVETTPVVTNQPAPAPKTVATQTAEHRLPGPYFYEYVTDAQFEVWVESGRGEVVAIGKKACQEKDRTVLSLVFEDLLRAGLEGRIDGQEAGSTVREIVESVQSEDTVERGIRRFQPDKIFLDILSICAEAWNVNVALKPIVFSTNISAQLMRLILDSSLLESLGLIRSTFVRVGIRQQTNLLYRQSNYNLLREETEGYSKLITELFTTSSGEALSSEVVEETFERVKGMIGAFDLDVGRVLDVTLDVFAALLVKQYRFFVKYLRVSSWWPQDKFAEDRAVHGLGTLPKWALPGAAGRPISDEERAAVSIARDERDKEFWQRAKEIGVRAFFEIGNRRPTTPDLQRALDAAATGETEEADEDLTWMDVTGTLPPVGNKIAAQILGFKLKFYSSSARDASDILPLNIIYLAALLIKVGFISLRDLYPHLWPSDDVMNDIKETKMKENAEKERLSRPGANMPNALLSSRALTDDRTPAQREAARKREEAAKLATVKAEAEPTVAGDNAPVEEKDELPEPAEQKVQLLKSLLCIGAIPESLYMLGRFPWLLEAFTELPEYLHRILHHSLNKVYEPLRPLKDHSDLREQSKILDGEQPASAKGQLRFLDAVPRKIMRWAQLDKDDTNEGIDYRFYWDDWADSIPVCQTVDDVFLLCSTLLNLSGVRIGQDSSLLAKLCRIGRHSLDTDRSEANKTRWIDLSKRIILPALSLTKSNPGVANEVFDLIKGFSLHTRYSLYAEWFQGQTSRLPEIKSAIDRARLETTNVLKRISKSNVRTMARALAKISYSCPGAVFQFAISQIEFYENFAETFTECARYLTYLAYDVFNWALLSAVGGAGKSRVQADGMLTSHWLQSLTVFIGKVYKRYSVMSPVPMLQYVLDQLTRGNSVDLLVVEEMVTTMAGIVSDTNFNDAQVEAMAGGDLLQAQTMLQLLDRRHECRSTAKRLMRCLAEPKLAGQLLVAIAQERENSIYNLPDKDAPGKLLGNLFDEVHRVLTQYLDFMRSTLSITDFNALVPGVSSLIIDFGLVPAVAFWISRASITTAMSEYDASHPTNGAGRKQSPSKELLETEALGAGSGNKEQNQNLQSQDQASVNTARIEGKDVTLGANGKPEQEKAEVEMKDVEQVDNAPVTSSPDVNPALAQPPWHPVLREIMDRLQPAAPDSQWEYLSVSFYVTFWQLTLRDMQVPGKSYENEQGRLRNKLQSISSDRSDISVLGTQRKEREKKAIQELMDRLVAEHKERISGYSKTRSRLQKEKLSWFPDVGDRWDDFNTALIEQCFFPRIRISLVDALYAFKMFKYLHSSGTTNFRTLKFLDQLFVEKRLESLLYLCSAKEAEYLGRFLREMLKDLSRWHADKALFEKEAFGTKQDLKGFCIKTGPNKISDVFMDYEDFRRILNKWHQNINNALKKCFSSGEYMHIRNAINVSNGIVETFPAVNWMGKQQAECIEHVIKTEAKRPDLHLAAASLLGHLRRREKEWVIPQAFSLSRNEHGANGASVARSGSAKPSTPQPAGTEKPRSLNPNAPTFEPSPRTTTNGLSKPSRRGDPDAEDGEIEDAKVTDTVNASGGATAAASEHANIAKKPVPVTADSKAVYQEASKPSQGQIGRSTPDQVPPKPTAMRQIPLQGPQASQVNGPTSGSVTGQASVPPRPEVGINSPSPSANGRQQHSLPDRPEPTAIRSQPHRVLERGGDRHVRDDGADVRSSNGLSDSPRARMPNREVTGKHPRANEPSYDRNQPDNQDRSDQQLADKRPRLDYDDSRGGLSRQDLRPRNDVQQPYARGKQFAEQQSIYEPKALAVPPRDSMPPPRSSMPHHPDRAALIQGNRSIERPFSNSQYSERRPEPSRHDDYPTSGRSSRGASPARSEDRRPLRNDNRRDVRPDDRPPAVDRRNFSDSSHSRQSRYEDGRPPAGPRTNLPGNFGQAGPGDRFHDSTKPPPAARSAVDPNHGRLNQDSSFDTPQAEQYGRLNAGTEVPSGPRMPNGNASAGRNMRNVSAPQPLIDTRQPQNIPSNAPPASSIHDRQAPTGPSSNRGALRGQGPPFNRQDASASSAPPTPAAESPDTVGIHPDRLKALQGISDNSASQNPDSMNPNSIQIHGRGPPTRQPVALQQPPPVTVPRGPSSQQPPPSPAGPSPTSRAPPTGPGRGDKRFAGIQGVLQQANAPNGADRGGQGTSIRGRGGRPNHVSSHAAATSGPPTPSMQRPDQLSQRQDLFADGRSGPPTPQPHPADYETSYNRDARRNAPHDVGREDGREGGRDGRSVGREHMRDGGRDSGRDAGRDAIVRDGDRRSTRHRTNRSHERDHGPPPPPSQRDEYDYERQPPRRDEGIRELRPRGGPPAAAASSSSSRPIRSEVEPPSRERRGAPPPADYRDQGEWGRSERDRRDGGGRKRGRPGDEGPPMGSGDKRARRGP